MKVRHQCVDEMWAWEKGVIIRVGHAFFSKERNVLSFFCVLYKRTWHSLPFFAFFLKERRVLCVLFGFISHTKMTNLGKKEPKRTVRSFLGLKKNLKSFFAIHIYIYIYISIYIYKYIFLLKNEGWACVLFKRPQRSAFFCIRT